jgi:hypothetical protein
MSDLQVVDRPGHTLALNSVIIIGVPAHPPTLFVIYMHQLHPGVIYEQSYNLSEYVWS